MSKTCKIYLAGSAWHQDDWGKSWRDHVKEQVELYYRRSERVEWNDPIAEYRYDPYEDSVHEVVQRDKEMIRASDAMLVGMLDVPSVGTWREVEFAQNIVPVAIWTGMMENPDESTYYSPWVIEAGLRSDDLITCLDYLLAGGDR